MVNKVLKVLFVYNGIFVLAGSLLGPLYALYVEKLEVGILPVSISWAAFLSATTIVSYLLSKNGDGIKHKRFLLAAGYLIRALSWFSMGLITQIEQLFILQILLGIGEGLGTPAFDAIFAEHLDKNKHIMDYSDWKIISNGVLVAGTLIGGYVVSRFGFQYVLFGMSTLALISFFGILLHPKVDYKSHSR